MDAQLSLLDAPTGRMDRLKPQSQLAVRAMIERGGLTTLEAMRLGIGRLSARVMEIREVFGSDAVETERVPHKGSSYARYRYHGPRP